MDFIGAWKSTMEAVSKGIGLIWGTQTLDESSLRKRAELAAKEKQQAKEDLRRANIDGDIPACTEALGRLNKWSSELKRLEAEAAAKRE